MLIHESFDKTLRRYNISAKALSDAAGVSTSHVSQFRNGKGGAVSHTTLEDMLDAMEQLAPNSRSYFCLLLAGKSPEQVEIDVLIESMDYSQIGSLLTALAKHVPPKVSRSANGQLQVEQVAV